MAEEDRWMMFGEVGGDMENFEEEESLLSPDIFSYTHLMSSLEKLGRERACVSALKEMSSRGIQVMLVGGGGGRGVGGKEWWWICGGGDGGGGVGGGGCVGVGGGG